jgi:coenzyme PQQ synthesis protein D (PqqD)
MDSRPLQSTAVLSQLADQVLVLLHLESGQYFTLDRVGARIWHLCDGARTADQIVHAISQESQANETVVRRDTAELLSELHAVGLIAQVD